AHIRLAAPPAPARRRDRGIPPAASQLHAPSLGRAPAAGLDYAQAGQRIGRRPARFVAAADRALELLPLRAPAALRIGEGLGLDLGRPELQRTPYQPQSLFPITPAESVDPDPATCA